MSWLTWYTYRLLHCKSLRMRVEASLTTSKSSGSSNLIRSCTMLVKKRCLITALGTSLSQSLKATMELSCATVKLELERPSQCLGQPRTTSIEDWFQELSLRFSRRLAVDLSRRLLLESHMSRSITSSCLISLGKCLRMSKAAVRSQSRMMLRARYMSKDCRLMSCLMKKKHSTTYLKASQTGLWAATNSIRSPVDLTVFTLFIWKASLELSPRRKLSSRSFILSI